MYVHVPFHPFPDLLGLLAVLLKCKKTFFIPESPNSAPPHDVVHWVPVSQEVPDLPRSNIYAAVQ